jgi:membrane fusion protein (multidrug efflux system)
MTPRRLPPTLLTALVLACGPSEPPAPPPVDVVVTAVEQRDVPITSEWIGTTEGQVDAEIRAQITGTILARRFAEGTPVEVGDLLFEIDPRTYRAALDQARGELARLQAVVAKNELDVARYTPLAAEGAVSQQELDNAIQARNASRASVESARAAVETARINLDYTQVRSPIDGVAGVANAQVGDLVGPGDANPLTRVSQLDPIRVAFPLSEREYLRFASRIRQAQESPSTRPRNLELILTDGSVWPHRGVGVPAGLGVDPKTGTILARGEFPNPEGVLRPGQYARVRVVTDELKGALVVPQRAVAELQGTYQVAVVGDGDKVSMRVVEPGPRVDKSWVITKGLQPGERVVVEGLQKVRDGAVVKPQSVAAPGN